MASASTRQDVTFSAKGGLNTDTLMYQNGTEYAGTGAVDTFYADLSAWTEDVIWTNGRTRTTPLSEMRLWRRYPLQSSADSIERVQFDQHR